MSSVKISKKDSSGNGSFHRTNTLANEIYVHYSDQPGKIIRPINRIQLHSTLDALGSKFDQDQEQTLLLKCRTSNFSSYTALLGMRRELLKII